MSKRPPVSLTAWLRYAAIERLLPIRAGRVLEIGAGLGSIGLLLARRFEYVGLEPDPVSFEIASRRVGEAGRVVHTTAEDYEDAAPFDLVCAFEVLEHTIDDRATLAGWISHLRPGGYALLSVPFGHGQFGSWDEKAGHYRRYERTDIVETCEGAGLHVVGTIVYGFPLASVSQFVRNLITRFERRADSFDERTAGSARLMQPPGWAAQATWATAAPFRLLQRPFAHTDLGTGIVALAKLSGR